MQGTPGGLGAPTDCTALFSLFEQVSTGPAGTAWYVVEHQFGQANKITSSGSSNLFLYERPGCRAELYFADGRAVRKSFVIVPPGGTATTAQSAAQPLPLWSILVVCIPIVIIGIVLLWRMTRTRPAIPYGRWPEENFEFDEAPMGPLPLHQTPEPSASHTAGNAKKPTRAEDDAPGFNQRWGTH